MTSRACNISATPKVAKTNANAPTHQSIAASQLKKRPLGPSTEGLRRAGVNEGRSPARDYQLTFTHLFMDEVFAAPTSLLPFSALECADAGDVIEPRANRDTNGAAAISCNIVCPPV